MSSDELLENYLTDKKINVLPCKREQQSLFLEWSDILNDTDGLTGYRLFLERDEVC